MQAEIFLKPPEGHLRTSTLRNQIEQIYYEIDRGRYRGEGNIVADRSAMAAHVSLVGDIVYLDNKPDRFCIREWNEAIPWLNRNGEKRSNDIMDMKRVEFRRGGMPINGDFWLISDRYNGHPVYHAEGLPLDGQVVPFCPLSICAQMAEIAFISDNYTVVSYGNGNVVRSKNGRYTFYDAKITLNNIIISTDEEFRKKDPRRSAWIAGGLTIGAVALNPLLGVPAGIAAIVYWGRTAKNQINKNENLIQLSRGAFNVSFCGNLAKRPLELPS